MDILSKVFKWHERRTEWWLNEFGMTQYQACGLHGLKVY